MPSYGYKCVECGNEFKALNTISGRNEQNCVCGSKAERDLEVECKIVGSFRLITDNPRYSVTLGVSETQIEEVRKLHPQAEWKRFGHSFRPLIKNRGEKLKLMKQAGYEEYQPDSFRDKNGNG